MIESSYERAIESATPPRMFACSSCVHTGVQLSCFQSCIPDAASAAAKLYKAIHGSLLSGGMLQLYKLNYASCIGALLLLTGGAHSRPYDQVSSSSGTVTGGARNFQRNQIARPDEGLLMHCNVTGECVRLKSQFYRAH